MAFFGVKFNWEMLHVNGVEFYKKCADNLWDGKRKEGNFVGDGVYFYRIELSNLKGFEKERKLAGYVHLIGVK